MRLGPDFSTRQFLLFRDLDDPDLWLAADGSGRWGEINGAERPDLRGCTSVSVTCSPSGALLGVRALDLEIGGNDSLLCATVDVETLEVVALEQRYTRLTERHWRLEVAATGFVAEFDTDEHGLVSSAPGWFSRIAPTS
jgi:hypothetical protein